jgi:hypothetical protein
VPVPRMLSAFPPRSRPRAAIRSGSKSAKQHNLAISPKSFILLRFCGSPGRSLTKGQSQDLSEKWDTKVTHKIIRLFAGSVPLDKARTLLARGVLCIAIAVEAVLYCRHYWTDAPGAMLYALAARGMLDGKVLLACNLFIPGDSRGVTPPPALTNEPSEGPLRRLLDALHDLWWAIEDCQLVSTARCT